MSSNSAILTLIITFRLVPVRVFSSALDSAVMLFEVEGFLLVDQAVNLLVLYGVLGVRLESDLTSMKSLQTCLYFWMKDL